MMNLKKLSIVLIVLSLFLQTNVYAKLKMDTSNQNKLIIDISDGYYEKGRYYLQVDDEVTDNYYVGLYKMGYIAPQKGKDGSDLFIEFGEKMILDSDIYTNLINIEYLPKTIMFNETIVYTIYPTFNEYEIPFIYKGKMIIVEVHMENEKGEIVGIKDEEGNKVDIPKGAKITPILKYRDNGGKTYLPIMELINHEILELDDIVLDDNLNISMITYNKEDYAIKMEIMTWDDHLALSEPIMLMNDVKFEKKINELFSKHKPSDWAVSKITEAIKCGLITEKTMKNYQNNITREEFCELAVKLYENLSKETAEPIKNNPFSDTNNSEVLKAYNLNIVSGLGDGIFAPNNFITREQLAVMIYNTIKAASVDEFKGELKSTMSFNDEDNISNWAIKAVEYIANKKFIVGSNGKFFPKDNTTIEQAVVVMKRVYEYYTNSTI